MASAFSPKRRYPGLQVGYAAPMADEPHQPRRLELAEKLAAAAAAAAARAHETVTRTRGVAGAHAEQFANASLALTRAFVELTGGPRA